MNNVHGAANDLVHTLSFTSNSSNSSYSGNYTVGNWTVSGNMSVGNWLQVGGNSTSNADRIAMRSTNTISTVNIGKIVIKHTGTGGSQSATCTLNSVKVEVFSDNSFTDAKKVDTRTITSPSTNGNVEITPTSGTWSKDAYYRITYNYKSSKNKNAYVKVESVKFYEGASTPSCDKSLSLTKVAPENGSFSVHQGTADGTEVANSGTVDNCGTGTTTLVVVPTPASDDYVVDAVTATNRKGSEDLTADEDGNYSIVYDQGSSIATSITVTFRAKTKYTISFLNNGIKAAEDIEVTEGENIGDLLPELTADDACHGTIKTFAGWTTEDVGSTPVHTIDASKIVDYWTEPDDDMVLNALWGTTSTTAKNQFDAANETAKTASANDPVSLTSNGITLSYTSGNVYHQNTNHNFGVNANTYCTIEANGLVIEKVVAACSGKNYVVDDISDGTLSTSGSTSTVSNVRTSIVQLFADDTNPLRMVTLSVYTYDNYITACVACTAAPTVGAGSNSAVTPTTATVSCASGLSALGTGGCTVTSYGFVIGTSTSPALNDNGTAPSGVTKHELGTKYETTGVVFSKDLENLTPNTEYFVRPYAINGAGIGYGAQTSFTTPQRYLISFNNNGGSGSIASVYKVHGVDYTLPANAGEMTLAGHHIADWKLGSASGTSYTLGGSYTDNAAATFYAGWEVNTHKFAWDFAGGNTNSTTHTAANDNMAYGSGITYPSNESMSRTGYEFNGWSSSATTMPDEDLTITAQWNALQYDITYKDKGDVAYSGNNSASLVAKHTYDAATALEAGTKDGYTFEGWFTDAACTGSAITSVGGTAYTANFTLYAKWSANSYKVVFNANGGTGDAMDDQNFTYDVSQKLSANTYTAPLHKYFYGWHATKSSADAGTRELYDEQSVQNLTKTDGATVTLYAVWKDHTYTNYRTLCCTPLAAPANIVVSVTGAATATVTWDAVADATGYEYKLGDGDWTDTEIAGNAANPELSLSGLTGATDYTIYVRTNGSGDNCAEGTPSAGTNFRTYSTVTAAVNDALMGTAKVSLNNSDWSTSVEAADGTTIYLQATPGELYDFSSWATPASGTISEGQLTGWSGDVTVTANFVAKALTKLDTPTGMGLVGEPGATSATIKWNAVDHASGYEVVCADATKGDITVTDGVASCPLTILTAGTTYNWTVKALGDGISFEDGDACASQSFTTVAKQPIAVAVTTAPSKTSYLEGESFDATGMVVRVTYNTEEVDDDADNYTITPAGALEYGTTSVTITVNGSAISTTQAITVVKKYTLTLKNNGVQVGEVRNLYEGAEYGTLPTLTAGDACDATSTTFMGWTTESILNKQSAAPASYASATSLMGTGNVVLNAVWAKTKTPGVEPVSITSFAAGTYYLIDIQGEHYYAMSGTGTSKVDGVDVTDYVSYNSTTKQITITDESHMTAAMKYTISGTTSAAKIYNANKSKWVSTQSSGTSFSDSEGSNVVTKHSEDPRFAFSYATMGTSGNRCILYRSSQSGFCNYATGNMNQSTYGTGYLWLVTVGSPAVYEDYLTSCCSDWSASAPAISYSTPDHWKAGDDDVAVSIASGTTYGAVSFESSDEDVLTVDAETGAIHAVAMGTATVTATWAGGVVDAVRYCSASSSVEVAVSGTVTVSFDGNDATSGTMTDQVIYYNEATALKANAFSKDGFDFYGWAETDEKADAGNRDYKGGETVTFTTDKTLYAVWQTKVHDLTLTQPTVSEVAAGTITANGSTTSPASIAYGVEVTLSASENSSALDGYVFENWSVSGITLADATANPAVFTMPDDDVAVAAVYHHYTWDLTGHEVTTAPETVYSVGDQFDKSSVVIKAGYERSDNSSTKQVTLEAAAWTAKLDGSAIADNYTFALADNGKTLTLWVGESQVGSDYVLTVNAIPTDHFVINIWTSEVSPIADKTSAYSMPSIDDQDAGNAATCKDHNLFVGWVEETYKDEPEGHIVSANTAMTPSNKTYYAVWGKTGTITESISYGWETGESTTGWSMSASKDGLNAVTAYHKTGEKAGATTSAGAHIRTLSSYATPKSISAQVLKQSNNTTSGNAFKLQYSNNASDWTDLVTKEFSNLSKEVWFELSYDLSNNDTYKNKYFRVVMVGGSTGAIDDATFTYTTSGAVDYITDCVQRYQLTFDANGGTGSYDAIEKKEGSTVTLPDGSALSRAAEHYHFNGWKVYNASTEEEISVSENQFTMPGAAVNAVAQWEEDPKGTIRYVGDEILNSSVTRYAGQTYDLRTEVTLPAGRKLVGWMLEGDETLYAPGRTMTMPDPVQNITYNVQVIDQLPTPSGVSFSDGEWVLVTNTNQLSAGDFVVIVANETTNAMGAQSTSNRSVASVTKHNEGQTITLTNGVATLFLQYGYKEGEFALYDMAENGYLYANSNTQNQLKTSETYSNRNYSWMITIGDGNIASIIAQGDNTHNNLQYNPNSGSPIFSCYTGGQTAVQLYRYDGHKTVEITENVNASAIYLDDADVVVKDGKTLTIDVASDLDNLTVEAGGKVSGSSTLNVNNLTIESEPSKSGQVTGSDAHVNGDIYLEIKLLGDGTGTMTQEESQMWYCISAPFEVSFNDGFFWADGNPMGYNVDFQAFVYDGAKRASNGTSGWQRAGGKMESGKAYLIGFDDERSNQKTIRLKAMSNTIPTASALPTEAHYNEDNAQANWNGVGNPTLHYIALDGFAGKVQCYNNGAGYSPYDPATHNYVVGTALFMQADDNIDLKAATNANFRAPKREGEENENYSFCVEIAKEGATRCDNRLYVSTSDEATSTYEQGKDMQSMNGTSAKFAALIWTENYGMRLASEDVPMVNQKASYTLGIYAPKAGTYSISTVEASEDAELYLTYNGRAIWNLSMSACELDLAQGQNTGYGLRLVVKAPSVVTGIENSEVSDQKSDVQKVIIDDHVYILRGGQMYDVNGKMVK